MSNEEADVTQELPLGETPAAEAQASPEPKQERAAPPPCAEPMPAPAPHAEAQPRHETSELQRPQGGQINHLPAGAKGCCHSQNADFAARARIPSFHLRGERLNTRFSQTQRL